MRDGIDSPLASFRRFPRISKEFELHTVYSEISEHIKSLQPVVQAADFKFESKFEPLPQAACHLTITPEGYTRRQKGLTAKSMAELLGLRSGTAWGGFNLPGWTGKHKHRVS